MESSETPKRMKKQDKIKGNSIQVFCRVRPLPNPTDQPCVEILTPHRIKITTSINNRTTGVGRDVCYTFSEIFGEASDQKAVFDSVALPLIENVLSGKNSLLFTYGVSGSGKTYTMTGAPQDGGILPRSLDVIFNSISSRLSKRCTFLPDKLNGYEIQTEEEAKADRDKEIINRISKTDQTKNKQENEDIGDLASRLRDNQCINIPDDTHCFGVFITYIEIYNNTVYDLLDDICEETPKKPLQSKIVREDSNHCMFVHGINEIEVSSSDEAYEIYYKGLKRKKMAQTCLNTESSRSHSVFTIKIVQAPMDRNERVMNNKSRMVVSQISLVDLAGSERTNKTKNTGQRLREAGNINNSLLSLRMCIEMMRDNQKGGNKVVPYRDCRLTHLFKNYFEGNGHVTMVLCITPHPNDLEEMMHVLKFAEITQDVQVNLPKKTGIKRKYRDPVFNVNQDEEEILDRHVEANVEINAAGDRNQQREESTSPTSHWYCDIPDMRFIDQNSDVLPSVVKYLEESMAGFQNITTSLKSNCIEGKNKLLELRRNASMNIDSLNNFKNLYHGEAERVASLEKKALNTDTEIIKMKKRIEDYAANVQRLQKEVSCKSQELSRTKLEKERTKEDFKQRMIQEQDRLNREFERKLRCQNSAFKYEIRTKEKKIKAVKKLLNDEDTDNSVKRKLASDEESVKTSCSTVNRLNAAPSVQNLRHEPSEETLAKSEPRPNSQKEGAVVRRYRRSKSAQVGVANRRYRRSQSSGNEVWLDHRPQYLVPSGTLMQPTMSRKKSITKLVDPKDVTQNTSKYCLLTQNQDSDGGLETRLYKADVIPTSGGGAQVLFNDIEVVHQESPEPKTPSDIRRKFEGILQTAKKPKN